MSEPLLAVEDLHAYYEQMLVEKLPDGTFTTKRTLPVRFVPFTRDREAK